MTYLFKSIHSWHFIFLLKSKSMLSQKNKMVFYFSGNDKFYIFAEEGVFAD